MLESVKLTEFMKTRSIANWLKKVVTAPEIFRSDWQQVKLAPLPQSCNIATLHISSTKYYSQQLTNGVAQKPCAQASCALKRVSLK